jgi:hypothetical protein
LATSSGLPPDLAFIDFWPGSSCWIIRAPVPAIVCVAVV